jgi:hypothetical protein
MEEKENMHARTNAGCAMVVFELIPRATAPASAVGSAEPLMVRNVVDSSIEEELGNGSTHLIPVA